MTADIYQIEPAVSDAVDAPGEPTLEPAVAPAGLIHELSRAMHATAVTQAQQLAEELAQHRAVQVEKIKAQAGLEAEQLELASRRDEKEVEAWAKAAAEAIDAERTRRIDARRERLQAELTRQDIIVEREVMAVEVTIEEHQAELDAFFRRLEEASDPLVIARIASAMPELPSLSDAAEAARTNALAEFGPLDDATAASASGADVPDGDAIEVSASRLMAVMDPTAASNSSGATGQPWPEPLAVPVPAGVGATSAPPANDGSRRLLRATPSIRPMERLRGWTRKPDDDRGRQG